MIIDARIKTDFESPGFIGKWNLVSAINGINFRSIENCPQWINDYNWEMDKKFDQTNDDMEFEPDNVASIATSGDRKSVV